MADLDILGALTLGTTKVACKMQAGSHKDVHTPNKIYQHFLKGPRGNFWPLTVIDTWDGLPDPPKQGTIITRAHGNWLVRLGITAVYK